MQRQREWSGKGSVTVHADAPLSAPLSVSLSVVLNSVSLSVVLNRTLLSKPELARFILLCSACSTCNAFRLLSTGTQPLFVLFASRAE